MPPYPCQVASFVLFVVVIFIVVKHTTINYILVVNLLWLYIVAIKANGYSSTMAENGRLPAASILTRKLGRLPPSPTNTIGKHSNCTLWLFVQPAVDNATTLPRLRLLITLSKMF